MLSTGMQKFGLGLGASFTSNCSAGVGACTMQLVKTDEIEVRSTDEPPSPPLSPKGGMFYRKPR